MKANSSPRIHWPTLAGGLVSLLLATPASSQSGGGFEIIRNTIDNGGGRSTGSGFTVTGTIGQWDVGSTRLRDGGFELNGGFWGLGRSSERPDTIFSDSFEGN